MSSAGTAARRGFFIAMPLEGRLIALLALAFMLPGLVGHDPWKTEDAIGIGIVHQLLNGGDWLLPRLAGEPYFEDGPLFYWVGALLAKLLGGLLPVHEAARLACALALGATLALTRLAGRALYGPVQGNAAVLALVGCLGLLVHSHEMASETGALAGIAAAYWGLAMARNTAARAWPAITALAAGIATAFLCKGPASAFAPLVTAMVLPLASADWRTRRALRILAAGVLLAAIVCGAWIAALQAQSPALLRGWFDTAVRPDPSAWRDQVQVLGWASWPAWPLALWELWRRRHAFAVPQVMLPLVSLIASLGALLLFAPEARDILALPVLLPLALLAGSALEGLRRGAANALTWFGAMTFSLAGFLVWLGWFAMLTGKPPTIARNFAKLEPGFVLEFAWLPLLVALLLTAAWLALLTGASRSAHRSLTFWAGGMTLLWGLIMTLWLPWIDYGKSYRGVAQSLQRALAAQRPGACIESRGLGEAQRAVFHYHAGIVTKRAEARRNPGCPLLLVQSGLQDPQPAGWTRVWEGSRPRDRERYRLYTKNN